MISEDRIQSFDDIKSSLTYIDSLSDTNIFLIISDTLGKDFLHQLPDRSQIVPLFIYSIDESKHSSGGKRTPGDTIYCFRCNTVTYSTSL